MGFFNPGFRAPEHRDQHVPPGQFVVESWPVLTYGPTPQIDTSDWSLIISGEVKKPVTFSWEEFNALPKTVIDTDIHCVTRWSKLGMHWEGVSVDMLIARAGGLTENAHYLLESSYGGYTTNLPVADVTDGQALVATQADGAPLSPAHGGPARLFVPHLYFWKSAKYVHELNFIPRDHPGFWEQNGYHNYGDPWREQRYETDY
jgi:DMSO/TMAO reductase YedYZ molybdopterin-dependent catalytic subunit